MIEKTYISAILGWVAFPLAYVVQSLADLTEIHLFVILVILGAAFGITGKMIRTSNTERWVESAVIGSALSVLGMLLGDTIHEKFGRNMVVGLSLLLAMMGKDGAQWLMGLTREFIGNIFKKRP